MMKVFNYLDELFPNPVSELNYSNNFEFLIAVVLSAQTTDKKVNKVTEELFKYSIEDLIEEDIHTIEAILKPLGMAKKKAIYVKNIAYEINKNNGIIPDNIEDLMKLSGVGRKTANLVLSSIYNKPYIAVDTHIMRVTKRLGIVDINDNEVEVENKLYKYVPKDRLLRTHQQLVLFGRYKCKAIKPECKNCKLIDICKYEKKTID
jgi:endonuclease-3